MGATKLSQNGALHLFWKSNFTPSLYNELRPDSLCLLSDGRQIEDSYTIFNDVQGRTKQHELMDFMNFNMKMHTIFGQSLVHNRGKSLESVLVNNNSYQDDSFTMSYIGFGITAPLFLDVEMGAHTN